MNIARTILAGLAAGVLTAGVPAARPLGGGASLMINGSFDHPDGPLTGWTHHYPDNRHYADNYQRVEVVPREGARSNVLRLTANPPGGTKVDGPPTPVDPARRYRLAMWGKTTGPGARIVVDGYYWRPGIRPHDGIPKLSELRRVYRSKPVYFGSTTDGAHSNPTRQWSRGVREFPDREISAAERRAWNQVEFVVVHVLAVLGASSGDLYIDDIVLERIE